MSEKVEALFAGEPPAPIEPAEHRIRAIRGILLFAIPMVILGIPCWTSVPGAGLTLWAWMSTDGEMSRIEAGTTAPEDAAMLIQLRRLAAGALALCVVTLIIQIVLLGTTFYERLWGSAVVAIKHLF